METRAKAKAAADADLSRYTQQCVTDFALEKVFQKLYTHAKFCKLQVELVKKYYVHPVGNPIISYEGDDVFETFMVQDRIWVHSNKKRKDIATKRQKIYTVKLNTSFKEAWCACMHFESHGIMCRYLISVYEYKEIDTVPQMFILDRWRKDIERRHTRVKVAYHDPSKTEEVKQYDPMMISFKSLCLTASTEKEDVAIVLDMVKQATDRVNERRTKAMNVTPYEQSTLGGPSTEQESYLLTPSLKCTPSSHTPQTPQDVTPTSHPTSVTPQTPSTSFFSNRNTVNDDTPTSPIIKDPPLKTKPHRTTNKRYLSCIEKGKSSSTKKKGGAGKKSSNNTDDPASTPASQVPIVSSKTVSFTNNQGQLPHHPYGVPPYTVPNFPSYCTQPFILPNTIQHANVV